MKKLAAAIGLSILLAACGGGGDSTPASAATAEGFWTGTASSGYSVALAVLETGETWGFYESNGTVVGALYGNTSSSGATLSGSGRDFDLVKGTVLPYTYSGTFSAKSTINVTTSGGATVTGTYDASYDQPASLAALAGTFSGQGIAVTVSPSGTITVPAALGCFVTGTATPRPTGKNVFDVVATFTGASCALGDGTTTSGIAVYNITTHRVLMMVLNSSKSHGFIYLGGK